MGPAYESEKENLRSQLSEAKLIDIPAEELPARIKEVKAVVVRRLGELLELTNHLDERDSAAYSLATLKKLETTVKGSADS